MHRLSMSSRIKRLFETIGVLSNVHRCTVKEAFNTEGGPIQSFSSSGVKGARPKPAQQIANVHFRFPFCVAGVQ